MPATDFRVPGESAIAPFTLTLHRGEGMVLAAMNWRTTPPPDNFVGFAIEYRKPGEAKFTPVRSTKAFPGGKENQPSTVSPFQKFRWVVFPYQRFPEGIYRFRVTPMFMDAQLKLTVGEPQEADLDLHRETHPGVMNVTFTRGFVMSQAFVRRYGREAVPELIPDDEDPLTFPHKSKTDAYSWMGFEAREAILDVLELARRDKDAKVAVVAYDLNEPDIVDALERLGNKLEIIIDDSIDTEEDGTRKGHGVDDSAESTAAKKFPKVVRQHMGNLQHNKTIVVQSPTEANNRVVCGSTNFTWRGLFVQNNHAVVFHGKPVAQLFRDAFDAYWNPTGFRKKPPATRRSLGLTGIDASVAFSPHNDTNAQLEDIGKDIRKATSTVLYSLAFLYQTTGFVRDAIEFVTNKPSVLVYGVSDRLVGINVTDPDGNPHPVEPAALAGTLPPPFAEEPLRSGVGNYMHHKFVVIDFDTADARVYFGSYNFSKPADGQNGENLLYFKDGRVATSFAIEALRIYDHYAARAVPHVDTASAGLQPLRLPPAPGETAWWDKYYTDARHVRDRERFAED